MAAAAVRRPLDGLFAAAFGVIGLTLGARPIADNSAFVHLRTGIDIVAGRGIPRVDPYSATAAGTDWVVQSWLPATAYGLAERLDDGGGLLVLNGALTALLAVLVHRLARSGSTLRTVGAALVGMAVSAPWWAPRPLLVGLACLALTMLVVQSARRPWLLLPIAWVWVNSHGSFPLGAVWLLAAAAGAALDQRRLVTDRFRSGLWFLGGLLLAAANPLGPRLLLFPFSLGERSTVFRNIVEWKPADFQTGKGLVAAVGLAFAIVVLSRRRVAWALAVPAGVFVLLGLAAQRNLAPAGIVLVPALAAALSHRDEQGPAPSADPVAVRVTAGDRLLWVLVGLACLALVANALSQPALNLRPYPVEVIREGERRGAFGAGQLVAAQDKVGGYLVLRKGRGAGVFIDDRYDMYPVDVSLDYLTLLRANPGNAEVLDRRGVDSVLWERSRPLVPVLLERGWREVAGDARWVLLQRPPGGG